jgi:hypothetical protein
MFFLKIILLLTRLSKVVVKVMHGRLKKHLCINNTLAHNNLAKEALTENP